ncbi:hypothetical protein MIND_00171700 [Mycena indigotica]|uniref:Uncharacterized protein n=1 Tax=Mycena indigotica TaxID=2126181 RepID=A0A8H6WL74_9AGAR|nr:uncharacterized protein MIND_00171700 [Mycena indigotica]KAF7316524.1 hypothetical protein MIND_00171700 [Mycena indigotica]
MSTESSTSKGRGSHKSRGGLGKYLRARGRGRGYGRPAEFSKRLVLEDEELVDPQGEEAAEIAAEMARKFSRRQLGTNADRYVEPEPELDDDGQPVLEPEIDLSAFLERQRLDDIPSETVQDELEDVDHTLAHISSGSKPAVSRKGKVQEIKWDEELESLEREKTSAEAIWELKSRFRAKSEKLKKTATILPRADPAPVEAPPLPLPDGSMPPPKDEKEEMQDFLDDLLG